jgi:hypothetical protein
VFQNPVGFGTRPAVFQAKALQNRVLSGSCSETEVSEQLYYGQTLTRNRIVF